MNLRQAINENMARSAAGIGLARFLPPRLRRFAIVYRVLFFVIVIGAIEGYDSSYITSLAVTAAIYAVAAIGLTVLLGWVGQPSIMSAGLLLAGGYCAATLANVLHFTFLLVLVGSIIVGAIAGWLISIPARRLGGLYQLLATLAVLYFVIDLGNEVQSAQQQLGGYVLPTASIGGWQIANPDQWLIVSGVCCLLVAEYFRYLRRGRIGRSWILIRESRDAAEVSGVQVRQVVSIAFAVTTAATFLAGALLAYELQTVSFDAFDLLLSVSFVVMIVLGGIGSPGGAIVGAAVVVAIPALLQTALGSDSSSSLAGDLPAIEGIVFAIIGAAVLLRFDRGGWRLGKRVVSWWRRRRTTAVEGSRAATAPSTQAGTAAGDGAVAGTSPGLVPSAGTRDWLIRIDNLNVRYASGAEALHDINLELAEESAVALIGRNGAGKTTLLQAIVGYPPGVGAQITRGEVWLNTARGDRRLTRMEAIKRTSLGLRFVPAEIKIFGGLTVREQLDEARGSRRVHSDTAFGRTFEYFPDLEPLLNAKSGLLSGGERQQLAMAVALLGRPRLLVIDEASLGLAPMMVSKVTELLKRLHEEGGMSLVIAEQNPAMAFGVAEHLLLLENGRVTSSGPPSEELHQALLRSYLGAETATAVEEKELAQHQPSASRLAGGLLPGTEAQ
jgi:branched-chain amino acid transport system permease protein